MWTTPWKFTMSSSSLVWWWKWLVLQNATSPHGSTLYEGEGGGGGGGGKESWWNCQKAPSVLWLLTRIVFIVGFCPWIDSDYYSQGISTVENYPSLVVKIPACWFIDLFTLGKVVWRLTGIVSEYCTFTTWTWASRGEHIACKVSFVLWISMVKHLRMPE